MSGYDVNSYNVVGYHASVCTVNVYDVRASVVDADGKSMAGVLDGATNMIGSYAGCNKVKATGWNLTILGSTFVHDFDARYCRSWWIQVTHFLHMRTPHETALST